jgi:hypothetical protein
VTGECLARAARSNAIIPLTVAALLLALTGVGSWVYGSPAAALAHLRGESLSLSADYLDFGTGKAGAMVERTVDIRNWTDQRVRLIGGTSDCSCVTTADLPVTVPPQQMTTVHVSQVIPLGKAGVITRLVTIRTDCPKQPVLRFQIGSRVVE